MLHELEYNKKYKHYKNNNYYIPLNSCKIQINDIWVDAVIYQEAHSFDKTHYVRSIDEFLEKFKRDDCE